MKNNDNYIPDSADERNDDDHDDRNGLNVADNYRTSEGRQYKELTGRTSGIVHDETNILNDLSLNRQNMHHQRDRYYSESSFDHENHHSAINYDKLKGSPEVNHNSKHDRNEIVERDKEDPEECSDQAFRYLFIFSLILLRKKIKF